MVEQLTLGIIIAAALADSINPCVFGVLIFLLAYMTSVFKRDFMKLKLVGETKGSIQGCVFRRIYHLK